jgi:D-alanyl-D-alanine carboxypeptidase
MPQQYWQLILKWALVWVLVGVSLVSCGTAPSQTAASTSGTPPKQQPATTSALPRPVSPWVVGAMPLPRRKDGFGVVRSTPPALLNRRIPTVDRLPAPPSTSFQSTISPVSPQVLARSTWKPICPVKPEQLRYLTMSFRGFDARAHTGEMLVNAEVAQTVVGVFKRLFAAGFPMEEMRITPEAESNLPPTGDRNNTEGFVCRLTRGQKQWSAQAHGLAITLNPFNNPYVKGDLVLPELASSYLDRDWVRSGMALEGGPAVTIFESVGWKWGGWWSEPVQFGYFTATGRP